ncbi:hypothetical protein BCD48_28630 [Pseudofrankia sp. BMG5.36]|nr:hypothetical protein BCD48_28630 [Pseudofrankia sp. BMG5.36]
MLLAGIFMIILDFFIVNVAIPSMQADLGASQTAIQWVVAGFGLALGCGQIIGGRLGDSYGRRRLFTLGMALFTVASAVCGLADSSETLIVGRVAQGLAAALMSPQILSIISVSRVGARRARAVAAYGTTMGMAAACGQLIGGALTQADVAGLGWRACFLINVPIGVAVVVLAPRAVRESRLDGPARVAGRKAVAGGDGDDDGGGDGDGRGGAGLDLVGATLATVALVAAVLPLVQGRDAGWPLWTWLCFAGAAVLLAAFGVHQRWMARHGRMPLVDPALFRERAFTVGLLAGLVFFTGIASLFLVLALYLQNGLGLDALRAGLVFTQLAVGYLVTSFAGGPLVRRFGRAALAAGALEMAAGLGLLALVAHHVGTGGPIGLLTPPLLIIGAGMGMVMAPLIGVILAGVAPRHAGTASGMLATAQQVGNALGVAIVGVIFFGALSRPGGPAGADSSEAYPHALVLSIGYLAAASVTSAALLMLLPAARRSDAETGAPRRPIPDQGAATPRPSAPDTPSSVPAGWRGTP